jgi:UPF0716 protein FxsA
MAAALVLAFVAVPIAEIYVIIQIGHAIGGWQTAVLLLVWSAFGAWLVKREGRRAWSAFRAAAGSGRLPGREVADAALVLVGGVLLLTPGFITDAVGLFLVVPFTRPLARRLLLRYAARRAVRGADRRSAGVRVVDGEWVDSDRIDRERVDRERRSYGALRRRRPGS